MSIREHLEAIRDRADDAPDCACSVCLSARDAAAALAQLDNAPTVGDHAENTQIPLNDSDRLVSDPVAAATPLSAAENLGGLIGHPSPPSGT